MTPSRTFILSNIEMCKANNMENYFDLDTPRPDVHVLCDDGFTPFLFPVKVGSNIGPEAGWIVDRSAIHLHVLDQSHRAHNFISFRC